MLLRKFRKFIDLVNDKKFIIKILVEKIYWIIMGTPMKSGFHSMFLLISMSMWIDNASIIEQFVIMDFVIFIVPIIIIFNDKLVKTKHSQKT